ncbi:WD40 repeat domain-containing protein [Alsobacter sp. SYSU M60028]|uniref:WD40 repeat domain-containing protein n=1 Tax=Alsobacter ponti TaxID=2962936 RepID=A0ABT1LG74_9HYPH|nr:WD40 repeat domain-containing protein [Alsobacter ponti]MCP8939725.1 WD40 repeat domain-containing protein [Alsobacter ponti]
MTSLVQNVSPIAAGAHVIAAAFPGDAPALALADGAVLLGEAGERRIEAHPDAGILVAAADRKSFVTGGDDGRVVRIGADGVAETLADEKGRWIDALALAPGGALAWSTGKRVTARDEKGRARAWDAPSTAQGLCFAPKGYRLAVSHYNGASLWFPNAETPPEKLEWKGSHLDVTWSPDGRFVVTSMQENTLHGWRVADKKDMRMSGYPSKTRSFSWAHDGQWLATSGADAAIVWPFAAKDGPMGKAPRECGIRPAKVSRVACHPGALVVAVGYEDGFVLLCRLTDGAELLVRKADPDAGAITALAWDRTGRKLLFGTEGGAAGLLSLPA